MKVNLRRGWFAPDGALYEATGNPHSFPDAWEEKLPSSAKVLAEVVVAEPPKAELKPKVEPK